MYFYQLENYPNMSLVAGTSNNIISTSDDYSIAPYKNQPVLNNNTFSQYCYKGTPRDVKRMLETELSVLENEEKAILGQGLRGQEKTESTARTDIDKHENKSRASIAIVYAKQGQNCLLDDISRKRKKREVVLAENRVVADSVISEIAAENDFFLMKYAQHSPIVTASSSQQHQSLRRNEVSTRMQLASIESMDRLRYSRSYKIETLRCVSKQISIVTSTENDHRNTIILKSSDTMNVLILKELSFRHAALHSEMMSMQNKSWLSINILWWKDLQLFWSNSYDINLPSLSPKPPSKPITSTSRNYPTESVASMKRDPVYAMERCAILRIIQQHREFQLRLTKPLSREIIKLSAGGYSKEGVL